MSKKSVTFKELQNRFLKINSSSSKEEKTTDNNTEDLSANGFDVQDPKTIFYAGTSLDSLINSNACKDGSGGGAGCCGDSGCDSGGASDGGSCE